MIITLQRMWISWENRCKERVNLLILLKIYRLQITDGIGTKKPNFRVMFLNPLLHLLKNFLKVVRLFIVDLKNIQSILLRDENLNSSKVQNSPPDICIDSTSSGNASSNDSMNDESEMLNQNYRWELKAWRLFLLRDSLQP